jgi:transposase InsO family protein
MLSELKKNKQNKNSEYKYKKPDHYKHIDDVIDDAHLLSDLRKPNQSTTKTDSDGQILKKSKNKNISPILFVKITKATGKKKRQLKTQLIKALVDTGASESIISLKSAKGLPLSDKTETKRWSTAAGILNTSAKTKRLEFSLPELQANRKIDKSFHIVDIPLKNYDMIIGRDLITSLQLDVKGSNLTIQWDDAAIPWRNIDSTVEDIYLVEERQSYQPIEQEMQRMTDILDAKYKKANLEEISEGADHLTNSEQKSLLKLLKKYEDLFDGTLGTFTGKPYDIKLKDNVEPHHARPFPVPKIHELTLKSELDRLVELNVLKRVNRSQWGAPTFIVPKKDGTVRFISDFRELNKRIKRQPYPIPKIQNLLLKLEGFKYGTSLDLNMGYYHIELSDKTKELCTITTQWGKYEYQRLPMGLCNSPDIFQEKMNDLLDGLDTVRVYIDDILHVTKGSWEEHLTGLEEVFRRLQQAGLKVNAKKSNFGAHEMEYLGYNITRTGIQPIPKKVQAIQAIKTPKTRKQLRGFIGMINFYRDMWKNRSSLLAPLTALTSKNVPFKWTEEHQKNFDAIKRVIGREVLLAYPDFNAPFQIHTDACKTQIGAVISQNGKPIAFYSRKMNSAQQNYTTTEKELLSIVATLKEFRNILLGQQITVFTDHKNLTYKNFNTERVMRWRLVLEEFGPDLQYIKGERNIVADALSRLEIDDDQEIFNIAECFGFDDDDLPPSSFPLRYKDIAKEQRANAALQLKLKNHKNYSEATFRGGDIEHKLIVHNGKIALPPSLQQKTIDWYHEILCHPGITRTEATIRQHFDWKGLRTMVLATCKKCEPCQKAKVTNQKYGKLPAKQAEENPWDTLCVDLIGPYKIQRKGKDDLKLWCLTMIDPVTGWFEMEQIDNKTAAEIADICETTWFTRYPLPQRITLDRGTEFMAEFAKMVKNDYGLKLKPITTRNPQANAIIERVHQTIGNIIRTFNVQSMDEKDPWKGILAATMFAVRATFHTTLQASPMQLVFGRDAILNVKHVANWEHIRQQKQTRINENNKRENKSRRNHNYSLGDKVLIKARKNSKHELEYEGPYEITQVNDNGTVRFQKGIVNDVTNIRRIKPFHE